jgi:hypothetical protein
MPENFDEFSRRHSQEQARRERLAKETRPEWSILKGFTSDFDGRAFVGHKFRWVSDPSSRVEFLILNHVAAMFSHSERNGTTINCTVRFGRRPPEPGKMFIDDKSGVSPKEWSLLPGFEGEGEAVVWFVPELGETHSSMDLAGAIAKELSEHHKRYEQHYGQWPAA